MSLSKHPLEDSRGARAYLHCTTLSKFIFITGTKLCGFTGDFARYNGSHVSLQNPHLFSDINNIESDPFLDIVVPILEFMYHQREAINGPSVSSFQAETAPF